MNHRLIMYLIMIVFKKKIRVLFKALAPTSLPSSCNNGLILKMSLNLSYEATAVGAVDRHTDSLVRHSTKE